MASTCAKWLCDRGSTESKVDKHEDSREVCTVKGKQEVLSTSELKQLDSEFQAFLITHVIHAGLGKRREQSKETIIKNIYILPTNKHCFYEE